jgi:predicted RND superfamily exporter protein
MKLFIDKIIRLRWLVIALVSLLSIASVYVLKDGLIINSDISTSLPDSDQAARLLKDIGNEFGGNTMGLVGVEAENVLQPEVIRDIARITDSLKYDTLVSSVISLTNIIHIRGVDNRISIDPLVDPGRLPQTKAEIDSLKKIVFGEEMYRGLIVSKDTTMGLVMFTIRGGVDESMAANLLRKKIEKMHLREHLYFAGSPYLVIGISDLIAHDLKRLIPISLFVILFLLWLSFKSGKGVVLPIFTAGLSILWTLASMKILGFELTMISDNIPIILLTVGSAYTIHVVNRVSMYACDTHKKKVVEVVNLVAVPLLMAALTTIVGFLSFVLGAYLKMIRDFGIFTALGVMFSLVLSLTLVPVMLSFHSEKKQNGYLKKQKGTDFIQYGLLQPLFYVLKKRPTLIGVIWFVLLLFGLSGSFLVHRNVNMVDYFKRGNPTRIAEKKLRDKLGGTEVVYVEFTGDVQSPRFLKTMKKTEAYLKTFPFISQPQSVADLIEQLNEVMGLGKKIPSNAQKIRQLWFLLDGQDVMTQLVSHDLTKAVIQARFSSGNSSDMHAFVDAMNHYLKDQNIQCCKVEFTGMPSVYVHMDNSLIYSQVSSLLLAFVLVFIIVALLMKSLKSGFMAVIPILATLLLLFGVMGFARIPLDVATVLVASTSLGIGVDYSVHVLNHIKTAQKAGKTGDEVIAEMLRITGRAVVINMVSVAAGFLVLMLSDMVPLNHFGMLIALSMLCSGFGAITLLPLIWKKSIQTKNLKS